MRGEASGSLQSPSCEEVETIPPWGCCGQGEDWTETAPRPHQGGTEASKGVMACGNPGSWEQCFGQGGAISSSTSDLNTQAPGGPRPMDGGPADGRPRKLKAGPAVIQVPPCYDAKSTPKLQHPTTHPLPYSMYIHAPVGRAGYRNSNLRH